MVPGTVVPVHVKDPLAVFAIVVTGVNPPGAVVLTAQVCANELKEIATKQANAVNEVKIPLMTIKFKLNEMRLRGLLGRIGGRISQKVFAIKLWLLRRICVG